MLVSAVAAAPLAALPGPLVDSAWLAAHQKQVVILDVRTSSTDYIARGHIEGAVFLPWSAIRAGAGINGIELVGMLPSPAQFGALMRKAGVNRDSAVVIVNGGRSAGQVTYATRLYWQMKYYGHDKVAILDGGMAAWRDADLPVSHAKPQYPPAGNFVPGPGRKDILATTQDVVEAIETGTAALFDARDFGQYLGLYFNPAILTTGGHIPGAGFAPIDAFLAPGKVRRFVSPARLASAFRDLGAEGTTILYCNTGHLASGTWFILHELIGNPNARLYDGSMHEWSKTGHPVETRVPSARLRLSRSHGQAAPESRTGSER